MQQPTAPRTVVRRSVRRAAAVAVALAVTSTLAGCIAGPTFSQTVEAEPTPSGSLGATLSLAPTAAETCAQLIDINSLIVNEKIAFDQGRIEKVEYDSANRLAGRLVHRVSVVGSSPLGAAVEDLRGVVGPYKPGAMTDFDPTTEAWTSAFSKARDECTREDVQFYIEGWTGG